jgi:hypothetical protein
MRAKNMQVLTDQIKAKRPGTTVWGISDDAHKLTISGHNEDDTPGVRAEDQDDDNIPEHRAIDIKIDSHFSRTDANNLVKDLVDDPANQSRMLYVIFDRSIWSRSRNWIVRVYDGKNPHTGHVHISGEADDDANETPWVLSDWGSAPTTPPSDPSVPLQLTVDGELGPKTIRRWQQVMDTTVDGVITPGNSQLVRAVQTYLNQFGFRLTVDGDGIYQSPNRVRTRTIGALQRYLRVPVDSYLTHPSSETVKALQRKLNNGAF